MSNDKVREAARAVADDAEADKSVPLTDEAISCVRMVRDDLIAALRAALDAEATRGEAVAYHKVAPPPPYVATCVCGRTRECAENWWLVERRDVQPPEWLTFTGCNPPTFTTDAWKAQRFGRKIDAIESAESVTLAGFKAEAIQHGFVGGDRVIAETRCPSCGSEWLTRLPEPRTGTAAPPALTAEAERARLVALDRLAIAACRLSDCYPEGEPIPAISEWLHRLRVTVGDYRRECASYTALASRAAKEPRA